MNLILGRLGGTDGSISWNLLSGDAWRKQITTFLLLFGGVFLFGQTMSITGTVTDQEDDFPLPGVTVLIKGTSTGTITDFDGKYELAVSQGDTLSFSYIGYATTDIPVGSSSTIDLAIAPASALLDEVVVVGYGSVKKDDLTGVVTKVGEEEFNRGIITSPEKLLSGKVAGLQVSSSGEPGGSSRIKLRGGTSLFDGDGSPLIVIDGVPLDDKDITGTRNPLNFVNPTDIADVTILKDASAAAIYGSRGANGVIIITTKSGEEGKLKVNYNGNISVSDLTRTPSILSPNNFRNAIFSKAPQEVDNLGPASTVWVDEITQLAYSHQNTVSVSTGSKFVKFYGSLNHRNTNGVLKTSQNQSSNLALNVSTSLFDDQLKIGVKSKTGYVRDILTPNTMGAALTFDPTMPVFDADSQYGGYYQWDDVLAVDNPLATIEQTDEKGNSIRTLNSLDLEYKLPWVEGLSLKSIISYDYINGGKTILKDSLMKQGTNFAQGGFNHVEDLRNYAFSVEGFGTYKRSFESIRSKVEFTAGYSFQDFDQENYWEFGNRIVPSSGSETGFIPTEDIKQDSFLTHNRLISFFGRLNYGFDERYLVTLSLRRDGSSRFGDANKWGLFPSAAFAWRVLQEDFAGGLNEIFSDLKLRVSYGVTGNQSTIGDFDFATFYRIGQDDARYQFGSEFINILRGNGVDPDIKWEGTSSINVGLDFGILKGRLSGSLELYNKRTKDLLFDVATAAFTNLSDRIFTNIGELDNKGIELSLNGYIIDQTDFDWKARFNAAYNRSEILKLDNSNLPEFLGYEIGGISGDVGQTIQVLRVGAPVGAFRTYQHILDGAGNPIADNVDRNGDGFASPLDIYEDINEDGIINENDLVIDKQSSPDFLLGFTSNMYYKKFDLGFTLRSNIGNYVYNNVASSTGYFDRLTDRVNNNIDESAFNNNFKTRQLKSNIYLENASFLKLDNITIGYTLDNLSFAQSLRVFGTVQNILTITGYSGLDPEAPQINNGIDNNIFPVSTNYMFGLNVSF